MRRFLVASVVLWLFAGSALGSTWRCGEGIISTGDSSAEVLLKCGRPAIAEEGPSVRSGTLGKSLGNRRSGNARSRRTFVETHVQVEHWYYDKGIHDFIYKLTFVGGVLANIETLRYGGYLKDEEPAAASPSSGQKGAAQESQSATGRVDIVGGPTGTKVYLDEFYACDLPCVIEEVEPGGHDLTARHEGYNEWRERILVGRESTLWLRVYLQPEETSRPETDGGGEDSQQAKRLFKWTDDEGRVHITDDPPPAAEPD